jgi:phenylacetic acid degradation protein
MESEGRSKEEGEAWEEMESEGRSKEEGEAREEMGQSDDPRGNESLKKAQIFMLYEFKGHRPVVDPSALVHPQSAVTGNVIIGKDVYIGPGAAIRGDWGQIIIGDGCNVQENCTIHLFPGATVRLMEGSHIGHGAIVHGATIGRNCLIGMNSVIMDNAVIGDESIIGALSLVSEGMVVPPRTVAAGSPARVLKEVSEEMLKWKTEGTAIYQALPREMQESWRVCEPLAPGEEGERPVQTGEGLEEKSRQYKPWKEMRREVQEPAAEYRRDLFTIEEYLQLEEFSNLKHEYYKGEVFLMSGTKADHNIITMNLTFLLGLKLEDSPCQAFPSDLRVYVEVNDLFTYPDLSIVCGEPVFFRDDDWNLTNPAAIFEVLSPTTEAYCREKKFQLYQGLPSLKEYILVDSRSVLVEHFTKNAQGGWDLRKYYKLGDSFRIAAGNVNLPLEEIYKKVRFLRVVK